jgi:UDP-glucuronate 4-epimerase
LHGAHNLPSRETLIIRGANPLQAKTLVGQRVLITGVAGFIGYHLATRLLQEGCTVIGLDNCNAYYDPGLKQARLARLERLDGARFHFRLADLNDRGEILELLNQHQITHTVHLAAQAGVRYSIEQPRAYVHSNLSGFVELLEAVRAVPQSHVIYASSSSVYGGRTDGTMGTTEGFSENDRTDQPVSLYAATKKANEVIAASYASMYGIPLTGVRFFTVYGPWGRPDMAYYRFADALREGRSIVRYGNGELKRDFTYIDDVVEALVRLLNCPPSIETLHKADGNDSARERSDEGSHEMGVEITPQTSHRILNIGHHQPVLVQAMIDAIADAMDEKPKFVDQTVPTGDVAVTCANTDVLYRTVGQWQHVPLREGIARFIDWHRAWRAEGGSSETIRER